MRLQFWGAAQTVTGSMHLLEVGGKKILLDCGLFQGRRKEAYEINRVLPFNPAEIHAVVLSHAHIDHIGNLPTLVRNGFRGKIYATAATRDLASIMLLDSAHIQESDVKFVNKHRFAEQRKLFEPLYYKKDAVETLSRFVSVGYTMDFEPAPGIHVHYRFAGHMLGAAVVVLDLQEGDVKKRLIFSGDIGRKDVPILRDPQTAPGADYVIMESTYGDRLHEAINNDTRDHVLETVKQTLDRGGKVIIPAFAVGRTQELLYHLNQLWNERRLGDATVYVDSPMAINATDVFRMHPECFDSEMLDALIKEPDRDPFMFPRLRLSRTAEDSKQINTLQGPAVIISASGMCESGRILHHLQHHIENPANMVLFVGYQAEHTLGRRIADGAREVSIYGERKQVRAAVRKIEGLSGHADKNGLLEWARETRNAGQVKTFFLVHGEAIAQKPLQIALLAEGAAAVEIPARGQAFTL